MFYYIKGEIVHKGENFAVIDTKGVGYKIYTSVSSLERLGELGSQEKMFTYLHVRDDIMDIYGFNTNEELNMFLYLISVSGVGPKAALSILSVTTPVKFAMAVITDDIKTITKAPGVGPKIAQRVILELKDKLKKADIVSEKIGDDFVLVSDNAGEAVSALMVLGYSQFEAQKAVMGIDSSLNVEDIVKQSLKKLMK